MEEKKNYCDLNHQEHDYRSNMKNGLNQKQQHTTKKK